MKNGRKDVCIKADIQEMEEGKEEGKHYCGHVAFNGLCFQYDFRMPSNLEEIMMKGPEAMKDSSPLEIKDDKGRSIELDDNGKYVFYSITGKMIFDYLRSPLGHIPKEVKEMFSVLTGGNMKFEAAMMSHYHLPMIPALESFLGGYLIGKNLDVKKE